MPKNDNNFEKMYDELESIVALMQSGSLKLDESYKKYERGMALITELEKLIQQTENKITKLKVKLK